MPSNTSKLGVARCAKLVRLFDAIDYDENGTIDINEFGSMSRAFHQAGKSAQSDKKTKSQFRKMDSDSDKSVDMGEFIHFFETNMPELSDIEFDSLMAKYMAAAVAGGVLNAAKLPKQHDSRRKAAQEAASASLRKSLSNKRAAAQTKPAASTKAQAKVERKNPKPSTERCSKIMDLFDIIDADKSGQIELDEFGSMATAFNKGKSWTSEATKHHFSRIDQNSDGVVDVGEFIGFFQNNMPTMDDQEFDGVISKYIAAAQFSAAAGA